MSPNDKPIVWLAEEVKTPPLSAEARGQVGHLLRLVQRGENIGLPHARPMPSIGARIAELRVTDGAGNLEWRVIYRADRDAVIVVAIFKKKTQATPKTWIATCQERLARYDGQAEG